jgi:hypothetical protein
VRKRDTAGVVTTPTGRYRNINRSISTNHTDAYICKGYAAKESLAYNVETEQTKGAGMWIGGGELEWEREDVWSLLRAELCCIGLALSDAMQV